MNRFIRWVVALMRSPRKWPKVTFDMTPNNEFAEIWRRHARRQK